MDFVRSTVWSISKWCKHKGRHFNVHSTSTCTATTRTLWWVCLSVCCVTFASQRVSLIVIPFCLSVWMSVGHSAAYSLPRLIDHNHVSLFGSPSPILWVPEGKICKISPISNTLTVGHAKPYSSYNSWSSLLIFGHNTLHRHKHRLTSAFVHLFPNVQMAAL